MKKVDFEVIRTAQEKFEKEQKSAECSKKELNALRSQARRLLGIEPRLFPKLRGGARKTAFFGIVLGAFFLLVASLLGWSIAVIALVMGGFVWFCVHVCLSE